MTPARRARKREQSKSHLNEFDDGLLPPPDDNVGLSASAGADIVRLEIFFFHAPFCDRKTTYAILVLADSSTVSRLGRLSARPREELIPLWLRPVAKVDGGGQLQQGGSERALCGDCVEGRP